MRAYTLDHVSDADLRRNTPIVVAKERGITVIVLLHIAEMDARKLYREEGFPSMHAYCVGKLRFSDDAAFTRILVARAARRFPRLFSELEQGRLHMTAVRLLAPHVSSENLQELIGATIGRNKADIERFLAQRFPETRLPAPRATIRAIPTPPVELVLGQVAKAVPLLEPAAEMTHPATETPEKQQDTAPAPPMTAAQPERFILKVQVNRIVHDDLRAVQELLGHAVPSGDLAQVIGRALKFYRAHLERKRFGSPRNRRSKPSKNPRHVPAQLRRVVRQRDGGRCTFVSAAGQRCDDRKLIEFDHVEPVARGGGTTVENLRLRCHAHNQLEAERVFGAEFMQEKREQARAP